MGLDGVLGVDGIWLPLPTRPQRYCDPESLVSLFFLISLVHHSCLSVFHCLSFGQRPWMADERMTYVIYLLVCYLFVCLFVCLFVFSNLSFLLLSTHYSFFFPNFLH